MREDIGNPFVEIYVSTPLHICEARDPKGLYRRARAGKLKNLTGVDDPYEAPKNCELELNGELPVNANVQSILSYLEKRGFLGHYHESAALIIGRFQPFHDGHRALFVEAVKQEGYVIIAVRQTANSDGRNPLTFDEVRARIDERLSEPNVTNVVYGRDVGYKITRVGLTPEIEAQIFAQNFVAGSPS